MGIRSREMESVVIPIRIKRRVFEPGKSNNTRAKKGRDRKIAKRVSRKAAFTSFSFIDVPEAQAKKRNKMDPVKREKKSIIAPWVLTIKLARLR